VGKVLVLLVGMESVCICGRSFSQLSAFTNHKRTCQSSKKRLSSALDKAKQLWKGPKRRRLQGSSLEAKVNEVPLAGLIPQPTDPVVPESTPTTEVSLFDDNN
jgi:hypothetical protein